MKGVVMGNISLTEQARTAAADGLPVFVARLPVSAPYQDARALPEWSTAIAGVESEGWTLQTMSIGQDSVLGVQGYLLFRR
jgi:hypothetical protein